MKPGVVESSAMALGLTVVSFALIACGQAPGAPSEVRKPMIAVTLPAVPDWHGRPVTMNADAVGAPEGSVVYVCATQPREYVAVHDAGSVVRTIEVDGYVSKAPCPPVPIE